MKEKTPSHWKDYDKEYQKLLKILSGDLEEERIEEIMTLISNTYDRGLGVGLNYSPKK